MAHSKVGPNLSEWNIWKPWKIRKNLCIRLKCKVACCHVDKARVASIELLRTDSLEVGLNWPAAYRAVERV